MQNLTRVLSFDPASVRNLGWSLVSYSNAGSMSPKFICESGTTVIPKVEDQWRAMWPIFVAVDTIISEKRPDLVVIEKTSSFAGGFVTGQVSNCIGVILACCGKNELPVTSVYPTHVKKVVTGNGRATKSQMKKKVREILQSISGTLPKFDSEHACDATANILCWLLENDMISEEE